MIRGQTDKQDLPVSHPITLRSHFSQSILLQMVIFALVVAAVILWQLDTIRSLYFDHHLLEFGLVINGLILVIFAAGMIKIVLLLLHYAREEKATALFLRNLHEHSDAPLSKVPGTSMIAERFKTMQRLYDQHAPISHSALAATTIASESTKTGLPRFVNNVLILTGVFGTIIALSIALLGASDLLEDAIDSTGMGMVIQGMSTALSTTMTAIACYLFFGYFYFRLNDVQTNLASGIEQITSQYLTPRFQVNNDSIVHEVAGLLRGLRDLVGRIDQSHQQLQSVETVMRDASLDFQAQISKLPDEINDIKAILREGFRLQSDRNKQQFSE